MMKAVITGDIINSTAIPIEQRPQLLQALDNIVSDLKHLCSMKYEVFRGDSFQILIDQTEWALLVAVLVRAGLRMNTPKNSKLIWDARVAVGVGNVEFVADQIVASDGEAFQLSGRAFDELGKQNLVVKTESEPINEELKVSTMFADDIISNWTPAQSFVVFESLAFEKSQKEIAEAQEQSAQNISKISLLAKEKLIRQYINRYHQLITHYKR
jgi:hypothetical protein